MIKQRVPLVTPAIYSKVHVTVALIALSTTLTALIIDIPYFDEEIINTMPSLILLNSR